MLLKDLMEMASSIHRETATGEYSIAGDKVVATNSGYTQVFSKRDIQNGLQAGKFTDQYGEWDVEVNPKMYGLSGQGYFVVENGDVMYEFMLSDFQ